MYEVYRPTTKGAKRAKLSPNDRIVFLGDGSCAIYNQDTLIQSDVVYRRPDSHCEKANEPLPKKLKVDAYELEHVQRNNIILPFELELV